MPPTLGDRDLNAPIEAMEPTAFRPGMPKSASDSIFSQVDGTGEDGATFIKPQQQRPRPSVVAEVIAGSAGAAGRAGMQARRSMQPRKSCLRQPGQDDTVNFTTMSMGQGQDENLTGNHTARFGGRPRVSFAPNAHVRMFEEKPHKRRATMANFAPASASSGSGSSAPGQARRQSRGSHTRRQSITNLAALDPATNATGSALAAPPQSLRLSAPRSSLAAAIPDRFVGEGDEEGEADMEMSDEEVEDGAGDGDRSQIHADASQAGLLMPQLSGASVRSSFALGAKGPNGKRMSLSRSPDDSPDSSSSASAAKVANKSMVQADDGVESEEDEEVSMEQTQVYGGIISEGRQRSSLASNLKHNDNDVESDDDEGEPMEMTEQMPTVIYPAHGPIADADAETDLEGEGEGDVSLASAVSGTSEAVDMDFTLPLGGIMPRSPPKHAARGKRVSLGYSNPGHSAAHGTLIPGMPIDGEDDEVPMDETRAYGGIYPTGYTYGEAGEDDTVSSEGSASDQPPRDRTETFNFGINNGVQQQDQIQLPEDEDASMEVDDEGESMQMTQAHGGIYSTSASPGRSRQSMASTTMTQNHTASSNSLVSSTTRNVFAPVSPAYPTGNPNTTGAVPPSFARPTVSSARKSRPSLSASTSGAGSAAGADLSASTSTSAGAKRNVFAPSPSPVKGSVPPREGAARDVAKRLSFAPSNAHNTPSSSAGRKRKGDEAEGEERDTPGATPAKRRSIAAPGTGSASAPASGSSQAKRVENVFAPEPATGTPSRASRQLISARPQPQGTGTGPTTGTPRKSLPAHLYLASIGQSPARSPMLRKMIGATASAPAAQVDESAGFEGTEMGDPDADFPPATVPLAAFLHTAGIEFVQDDVQLASLDLRRGPRHSMARQSYGDREFALHEYTTATVQNLYINMYSWATNSMRTDIIAGIAEILATEADCSLHNPLVIREYLGASEHDRGIFEMLFKSYRHAGQLKARERWYGWKRMLIEKVGLDVEVMLDNMREDTAKLDELERQTTQLLPDLQTKLAALQEELVKEREAVKEIEACPAEELDVLRQAIAEQDGELKTLESDVAESTATLTRLESSLAELNQTKSGHAAAITVAKGLCDQYTKSDVLRLRDELRSIQAMHGWEVERIGANEVALTFDAELSLVVPLALAPNATAKDKQGQAQVQIEYRKPVNAAAGQDKVMAGLREVFMGAVRELDVRSLGVPTYIQQVGQLYTSIRRIRAEVRYLAVNFPVTSVVRYAEEGSAEATCEVRASIMYPELKSRVEVVFGFGKETLLSWPESVGEVPVWVERVYGAADPETLTAAARDTIAMGNAEGYYRYMVEVCENVASA